MTEEAWQRIELCKTMDSREAEDTPCTSGFSGMATPSFPASRVLPGRIGSLSSSSTHGRLTSLRTRDLTLGGATKKPKKTFEPNVHVVRKSKDDLKEEIHDAPKDRRKREERKLENRGRRREKPQIIQSHSIFEQGPADSLHKIAGWSTASPLRDSPTSPICKPVKKERKDSEDDDDLLKKLQRDDFIDDKSLQNDGNLNPIQLPLGPSTTTPTCPDTTPFLRPLSTQAPGRIGYGSTVELPKPESLSLRDLLQDLRLSGREELFFMQLPDCMPCRGSTGTPYIIRQCQPDRPVKNPFQQEDKRPAEIQEAPVKKGCPVLSDLPEGFLGKLQIRRSGKVELRLGDIVMDVTEGTALSFLQQLVSVQLSEGLSGDMMVLGNVQHKLVLSPDFQGLLRQTPTQKHQQES